MLSKTLAAAALIAGCLALGGCEPPRAWNGPAGQTRLQPGSPEARLDASRRREEAKAVARTQHRLSETAPPQLPSGDPSLRDPTLREYIKREQHPLHPYH